VLSFVGQAAAKWSLGACASPTLQSGFDSSQYVGTWYEFARDEKIPFEYGDCTQARYSLNTDGTLNVHNSLFNEKTSQVDSAYAKAKCNGPQCYVKFFLTYSGDYRVVSTDYTNYSIVYSCSGFLGLFKSEYVWILTRAETLDAATQASVESIITSEIPKYGLDTLYYTQQGGSCVYLA
jgi:apolipoprotein D and lipocalin family protein